MRLFVAAGVSGFFAVFFGAFGSHILKSALSDKSFSVFQTANQYHFWHTLALLAVAIIRTKAQNKYFTLSATFYIVGLILFSGGLYLYALYSLRAFAMIAPLGGTAYMLGWLFLVLGSIRGYGPRSG
jgi:uncharacterized membrane protein YgdD (TMEM256/DUF423 family)